MILAVRTYQKQEIPPLIRVVGFLGETGCLAEDLDRCDFGEGDVADVTVAQGKGATGPDQATIIANRAGPGAIDVPKEARQRKGSE